MYRSSHRTSLGETAGFEMERLGSEQGYYPRPMADSPAEQGSGESIYGNEKFLPPHRFLHAKADGKCGEKFFLQRSPIIFAPYSSMGYGLDQAGAVKIIYSQSAENKFIKIHCVPVNLPCVNKKDAVLRPRKRKHPKTFADSLIKQRKISDIFFKILSVCIIIFCSLQLRTIKHK